MSVDSIVCCAVVSRNYCYYVLQISLIRGLTKITFSHQACKIGLSHDYRVDCNSLTFLYLFGIHKFSLTENNNKLMKKALKCIKCFLWSEAQMKRFWYFPIVSMNLNILVFLSHFSKKPCQVVALVRRECLSSLQSQSISLTTVLFSLIAAIAGAQLQRAEISFFGWRKTYLQNLQEIAPYMKL